MYIIMRRNHLLIGSRAKRLGEYLDTYEVNCSICSSKWHFFRGGFVQYLCFLYALLAIFFLVVEEATDESYTDYFVSIF